MIVGARQGGLSISETTDLLISWQQFLEFAENGAKKHPVSSSSVGIKTLLMSVSSQIGQSW